jgi:hypothetical protein
MQRRDAAIRGPGIGHAVCPLDDVPEVSESGAHLGEHGAVNPGRQLLVGGALDEHVHLEFRLLAVTRLLGGGG